MGTAERVFENGFTSNYKSIIVLANPKTILNAPKAPKNISNQVIKVDQLISYIKNLDAKENDANWSNSSMQETIPSETKEEASKEKIPSTYEIEAYSNAVDEFEMEREAKRKEEEERRKAQELKLER